MRGKQDDLHISILKFGKDRHEEGVTFSALTSHLESLGHKVSPHRLEFYFFDTYEALDPKKRGNSAVMAEQDVPCGLTIDSTFRLIEYEELLHANRSSKIATYFASAALIVSIATASASIYFSKKQLNADTILSQDQLTEILQLRYDDGNLILILEEMIKSQGLILEEVNR